MNKFIVTTTINPVTEALQKYSEYEDWHLIVVGDKKTPESFDSIKCTYLSPEMQEKKYKKLSDLIGWNCIQRRNLGFLYALECGAEYIASIDDDNIPLNNWSNSLILGSEIKANQFGENGHGWFDPISVSGYPNLWHRGFPIQFLKDRAFPNLGLKNIHADIQAGFWNGDPDVDAICRMEHAPECTFSNEHFPFWTSGVGPFNSQNTFVTRKVLREYFMYPHVGRMDDIWASFYVQALGYKVIYTEASVFQNRNLHDLTKDFSNEILGYENNYKMLNAISKDPESLRIFLPEISWKAFETYRSMANAIG